jgi:hypothetical protein
MLKRFDRGLDAGKKSPSTCTHRQGCCFRTPFPVVKTKRCLVLDTARVDLTFGQKFLYPLANSHYETYGTQR